MLRMIQIYKQSMLSRGLRNILTMGTNSSRFAFSSHSEPPPTKLSKVKDQMINVYVKNRYGMVEKVPAFIGESLLEAITRMKVASFDTFQICNGFDFTYRPHYRPHDNDTKGPNCAECRVVLQDNWFQKVHEQTDGFNPNEEKLLAGGGVLDAKSNSRLACCVPIESWMQGLTCHVDVTPSESEESILI